jgi:hypothetical protein
VCVCDREMTALKDGEEMGRLLQRPACAFPTWRTVRGEPRGAILGLCFASRRWEFLFVEDVDAIRFVT